MDFITILNENYKVKTLPLVLYNDAFNNTQYWTVEPLIQEKHIIIGLVLRGQNHVYIAPHITEMENYLMQNGLDIENVEIQHFQNEGRELRLYVNNCVQSGCCSIAEPEIYDEIDAQYLLIHDFGSTNFQGRLLNIGTFQSGSDVRQNYVIGANGRVTVGQMGNFIPLNTPLYITVHSFGDYVIHRAVEVPVIFTSESQLIECEVFQFADGGL